MIRIVKMHFREEELDDFLAMFQARKERIAGFPGCHGVKLLQDINDPTTVFTYSIWDGPEELEAYRHSELFADTWRLTKQRFRDKPAAWSVDEVSRALPK